MREEWLTRNQWARIRARSAASVSTSTIAFPHAGSSVGDAIRPAAVVHQDFRGLVTFSDPAVSGEIVHLYMTGLGDVQPRPPTGETSPFLSFASQRPLCWLMSPFSPALTAAPVLFAGIAPGLVGIYQVDVTIPASYPSSLATLGCSQGLSGDFATFVVKSM